MPFVPFSSQAQAGALYRPTTATTTLRHTTPTTTPAPTPPSPHHSTALTETPRPWGHPRQAPTTQGGIWGQRVCAPPVIRGRGPCCPVVPVSRGYAPLPAAVVSSAQVRPPVRTRRCRDQAVPALLTMVIILL